MTPSLLGAAGWAAPINNIIIINTHLYGAQHEGHWAPYKVDTI